MGRTISLTSLELNPNKQPSQIGKDHKNVLTTCDIHFNHANPSFPPSSSAQVLLNDNDKVHKVFIELNLSIDTCRIVFISRV